MRHADALSEISRNVDSIWLPGAQWPTVGQDMITTRTPLGVVRFADTALKNALFLSEYALIETVGRGTWCLDSGIPFMLPFVKWRMQLHRRAFDRIECRLFGFDEGHNSTTIRCDDLVTGMRFVLREN